MKLFKSGAVLLALTISMLDSSHHSFGQDLSQNNNVAPRSNQRPPQTKASAHVSATYNAAKLAALTSTTAINVPLDIVLVQDETGSFSDDLPNLRTLAPQIWDSINTVAKSGFRMSVVGFRDFARSPWGDSGDWVYRRVGDFTTSRDSFISAVNSLTAGGGNDGPEGQYAALDYLLVPNHPAIDSNGNGNYSDSNDTPVGQEPSFRSGAQRIILLTTDANFHSPANTSGYPGPSRSINSATVTRSGRVTSRQNWISATRSTGRWG